MVIPEDLIHQIAKGQSVAFIGSGLSQGAGLPGWPKLLRQMLDWGRKNGINIDDQKELEGYIEKGDLLMIAEELNERFGKSAFQKFMVEVFRESKPKPTKTHKLLTNIPFSSVLTSNYDKLIETTYEKVCDDASLHIFTHADYPELTTALRSGEFYILKIHGTIDRIETVILGTTDYRNVMHKNPAYRHHLKNLFSLKTILFLGFSLIDPDLLLLLDELKANFEGYTANHYALMNNREVSSLKQKRFQKDYGINIISYTPSSPHHPEVAQFLIKLAKEVKKVKKTSRPRVVKGRSPLRKLADEVHTWLQALRYEVSEPIQHDEMTYQMEAILEVGTVKQKVLVRCIGSEITNNDVDALDKILTRKIPQGWLISDKRISQLAIDRASSDESYQLFTLSDFLKENVWKNYFEKLTALVEKNKINEKYVDLACFRQEVDKKGREVTQEIHESLDKYIETWLKELGKVHISLLGEFGTGKTWFCRHFAYIQLQRYLQDPTNERLPLLITLRDFTKSLTAQQLINDALLVQYELPFIGNAYEVFQEMNRRGKLLLILDGFDEMARQVDYQTVVDNFWELAELVEDNSKVLLTSRTEYFRWAKEPQKILGGEEKGRKTIELSPPRFEVFNLKPFNQSQIRQVIINHLGTKRGIEISNFILGNENLAEMAKKPILVELLLAAMEEVDSNILKNECQVYLYATNKLLLRNIDTQRTFTSTADKLYFLCELAWEMISSQELRIHYKDIPQRIQTYFKEKIKDSHELDNWDFDLRNQTLLHRNTTGYYEFAHKSLAEYFVALKFGAELGCLSSEFATYNEKDSQTCRLPIDQKEMLMLAETFGSISLNDKRIQTVRSFLSGIIPNDFEKRLFNIISKTRQLTPEQVKYVGGNAATLLVDKGNSLKEKNLKGVNLVGSDLFAVDLSGMDLKDTNFSKADLEVADLTLCNLNNANFDGAILVESTLSESKLKRCRFVGANLERADLSFADLTGANFWGANLWHAEMHGVNGIELIEEIKHANLFEPKGLQAEQLETLVNKGAVCHLSDYDQYFVYFKSKLSKDQLDEIFSWKKRFDKESSEYQSYQSYRRRHWFEKEE